MAWSTLIKTSGYIALEVTVDMRIVSLDHRPLPGRRAVGLHVRLALVRADDQARSDIALVHHD